MPSSIFNTQNFKLVVCTGIDLSTATQLSIVYKSPRRITGSWGATIDPDDHTRMFINLSSMESGVWEVYGKALFPTGVIPGRKAIFMIDRE